MITTKFVLIIFIMLFGLFLVAHDYFKSKNKKKNALSESVNDKDGIPIVPRHLREISEKEEEEVSEESNDSDSVRFKTLESVAEQQKASKSDSDNEDDDMNTDTLISNTNDNVQTYQQITTKNTNIEVSIENSTDKVAGATISKPLPIPPVSIKVNDADTSHINKKFKSDINSLEDDMKLVESTDIDFDSTLEEFNSEIGLDDISSINPDRLITSTADPVDISSDTDLDISTHKLHYTAGYYNDETINDKVTENDISESITNTSKSISIDTDITLVDTTPDMLSPDNSNSFNVSETTQSLETTHTLKTEHSISNANQIEQKQTVANTIQNQQDLAKNSPIVDHHLEETEEPDQNSPLTNASDNINISILPIDQYSHISGEKLLKMVDDFGFKFGTMNMFHRYQNKDGSGILWFSMMGLTDEGIAPFDLNTLPNSNNFNGLVMFLSLPHPKVLQGFDSMMSIAGLIAREIDGYIVDEDGNEMTTAYKKKLRHLLQSTLDESL